MKMVGFKRWTWRFESEDISALLILDYIATICILAFFHISLMILSIKLTAKCLKCKKYPIHQEICTKIYTYFVNRQQHICQLGTRRKQTLSHTHTMINDCNSFLTPYFRKVKSRFRLSFLSKCFKRENTYF